jgi:hypothetical protein
MTLGWESLQLGYLAGIQWQTVRSLRSWKAPLALHALGGAVTPPWIIATLAVAGLGNVSPRTFQDAPSPTSAGCWSRSRSASASQPLRETSRNSSSPWSCVVTKPPMLGLEMPQSENGTGMLPCTSIVVAVRSAFSVNVTERV